MLPLKGHQQGPCTSQSGLSFEKWCIENSVDFVPLPRPKQVPFQPLMVIGRPLLTPWVNWGSMFLKVQTLLSSFHRDCPKSFRNLPKWNLSVVLNELTKAPFEPMKDTDLKHLTLKTAFLLALTSGKHRSKIHAWVVNKVSNLGQWEKVALVPSSDFIAKNQLAREGSQSVSPVTIPALTIR